MGCCNGSSKDCLCNIIGMPYYVPKVQIFENDEPTYEFVITAGTLPADPSLVRVIVNNMFANPGINFSPLGFTIEEDNTIKIYDEDGVITGSNWVRIEFFETKTIGDLVDCSDISC